MSEPSVAERLQKAEALLGQKNFPDAINLLSVVMPFHEHQPQIRNILKHIHLLSYIATKAPNGVAYARPALSQLARYLPNVPDDVFQDREVAMLILWAAMCADDEVLARRSVMSVLRDKQIPSPIVISQVETLAQWCARSGISCEILEPGSDVQIPQRLPDDPVIQYSTSPIYLSQVPGAQILPAWDIVLTADRTVLMDTGQVHVKKLYPSACNVFNAVLGKIAHYWPTKHEVLDEDVIFMPHGYLNNFGHWLVGVLPRLRAAARSGGHKPKVAVPHDISNKETETLRYFGFGEDDLVRCEQAVRYQFRSVFVGTFGNGMPPHISSVEYVRQHLYQPTARRLGSAKRVFISRGKVRHRNIFNQAELDALLHQEGFLTVDMSQLSWADQLEVVAEADVVMGLWGSNMFATYVAPSTCDVVVLWPQGLGQDDPVVAHTARLIGQRYRLFTQCVCINGEGDQQAYTVKVDCAALREVIHSLGNKSVPLDDPQSAEQVFQVGQQLAIAGKLSEAEPYLLKAITQRRNPDWVYFLAKVLLNQNKVSESLLLIREAARTGPPNTAVMVHLAEVESACGNADRAIAIYKKVLDHEPLNVRVVYALAYLLNFRNHSENVQFLAEYLVKVQHNLAAVVIIMRLYLPYLEEERRHLAGKPMRTGIGLDDAELSYSKAELAFLVQASSRWLDLAPDNLDAAIMCGMANAAAGDFSKAEAALSKARPRTPEDVIVSIDLTAQAQEFMLSATSETAWRDFPTVQWIDEAQPKHDRSIFVAADRAYVEKYVLPLMGSVVLKKPQVHFHLHVFDPDEVQLESLRASLRRHGHVSVSISTENIPDAKNRTPKYYHAIRFVRFMQYAERWRKPTWLIDADFILNGELDELFQCLGDQDLALMFQPTRLEPSNKIGAGFVGLSGNDRSLRFIRMVSAYVTKLWSEGRVRWGADQCALYLAMRYLRAAEPQLTVGAVLEKVSDRSFRSENIFWNSKVDAGDPNIKVLEAARAAAMKALN